MLDSIFGGGTALELFGAKVSLTTALDAFEAVIAEINRQKAEMAARTERYVGAVAAE